MSERKTILVIGTYDTKNDELNYMCESIRAQGGDILSMDVSVLGEPSEPTDISKHEVAAAGGSSIRDAINAEDENVAMQTMAGGASKLASQLYSEGRIDGMIGLGGTMGTDLMLDCCQALPPKLQVNPVKNGQIADVASYKLFDRQCAVAGTHTTGAPR